MNIEGILNKSTLDKLSTEDIASINEAVTREISSKGTLLENKMKEKFNLLADQLQNRFEQYVEKAVTEAVNASVSIKNDKQTQTIIESMINILENNGIHISETSTELNKKLDEVNRKLSDTFSQREEIMKELDEAKKNEYIYKALAGMRPEVIAHAIEHFKNKDVLDVEREIDAFLDGDLSRVIPNSSEDIGVDNLDLDKVKEALSEIDTTFNDRELEKETLTRFENAHFDKLARGLNPIRAPKISANITDDALALVENVVMGTLGSDNGGVILEADASDVKDALDNISDFGELGYNFNMNFNKKTKNQ